MWFATPDARTLQSHVDARPRRRRASRSARFAFDALLGPASNSGVKLRVAPEGGPLGPEFQLLDDFGNGHSSFAYLKSLPVDFLKIDAVYVKGIADDPLDLAIVRSINEIGQVMDKRIIAEFVESEQVAEKLREIGVDYYQGYFAAEPMPIETLA